MRGRKPTPTIIKIAKGNPGRRPLNDKEPKPQKGSIKCPSFLSGYAKEVWAELSPELDRLGLVTVVDRISFAGLCQAWAEFQISTETLEKEGRCSMGGSGGLKSHPAVAQQRSALKAIVALSALFGLDPSSRSRLKVEANPKNDPLEEFLAQ